ncbi:MAG: hypothetical protein J6V31_00755 [Tidjanibacter sp.]|nr:hypothetical protein [Tidjanibacter sp.]
MKKFFALAAMAAMFFACGEKPVGPNPGPGPGPEPDVFESKITIDGDFSDWDTLDASKVVVAENATAPVKYGALKLVKVYADEMYVNVYFEAYEDVEAGAAYHINLCFNSDNSELTGGYAGVWSDAGVDYLAQGWVYDGTVYGSYDPGVYPWVGEVGAEGWSWSTTEGQVDEGNGVAKGAGTVLAYEIQLTREMTPCQWEDTFTMGIGYTKAWGNVGVLPNATATEEDPNGLAPQMVITIDK